MVVVLDPDCPSYAAIKRHPAQRLSLYLLGAQDGDHHTVVGAVRHVAFHKAGHLRGFYEQLVALDEGAFWQYGPALAPQQG